MSPGDYILKQIKCVFFQMSTIIQIFDLNSKVGGRIKRIDAIRSYCNKNPCLICSLSLSSKSKYPF